MCVYVHAPSSRERAVVSALCISDSLKARSSFRSFSWAGEGMCLDWTRVCGRGGERRGKESREEWEGREERGGERRVGGRGGVRRYRKEDKRKGRILREGDNKLDFRYMHVRRCTGVM